jgi:heat shock protein HtpX
MAIAKRIALFLMVNILVITTLSIILNLIGANSYINQYGLDIPQLLIFCLVWGMGGSFISLALSRAMAKWTMSIHIIDPNNVTDPNQKYLLDIVYNLASKANLKTMPEVGIYLADDVNAFATGPSQSRALVAVSSGLLSNMNRNEIEAVLGHEISHVANGDMVTMTLLQGIMNAFVMFLSRIIAFALSSSRNGERSYGKYYFIQFILQIVFLLLGSMVVAWFSRWREFRADAGGARLAGKEDMINALSQLKRIEQSQLQANHPGLDTLMISSRSNNFLQLFASHPPLEERIARLSSSNY